MPHRIVPSGRYGAAFFFGNAFGFARILNDLGKRPYHPLRVIGILRENTLFVY